MTIVVNLRDFPKRIVDKPGRRLSKSRFLPADVVRIDRRGPYGNPYKIGGPGADGPLTREQAIAMFRTYAEVKLKAEPNWLEPLRGHRLACWCTPLPCHGDVLVELLERSTK